MPEPTSTSSAGQPHGSVDDSITDSITDSLVAEVIAAANRITATFGAFDGPSYFACFAPEATFLFHTTDRLFGSRAEYEAEWAGWEESGLRVVSCSSHDQRVDVIGDGIAVFTHRVLTTLHDADGNHDLVERETIVLRREADGGWLGVHEHLSPHP